MGGGPLRTRLQPPSLLARLTQLTALADRRAFRPSVEAQECWLAQCRSTMPRAAALVWHYLDVATLAHLARQAAHLLPQLRVTVRG
jgi:hypothetical protein